MAQIKQCDRCKKYIETSNQIGIVVGIHRYKAISGYIRPSKKLLEESKTSGIDIEYFPIEFSEDAFGKIDLCTGCFDDFMNLKSNV